MGKCLDCKWYGFRIAYMNSNILISVYVCNTKPEYLVLAGEDDKHTLVGHRPCREKNKNGKCTE